MAANPIDEAMQALADELWLASGRVRTLAKTLTAAQQQGQAVACGGCGNADPDKVCIGCLHPFAAPQPKQQGGAMEQLAARRIASLATQHQEPTT